MLFYAVWKEEIERASLLIDARDQAHATDIATKIGEDDGDPPPDVVMAIPPGVIVGECLFEDTENPEESEFVFEMLDVSIAAITALEERIDAELAGTLPPTAIEKSRKPAFRVVHGEGKPATCKSRALDALDRTIQCGKPAGHVELGDLEHAGEGSIWTDRPVKR